LFAAIGVVVQLKDALNTVWDVKSPPGKGVWRFARTYVLSLAGVLALGFLLLISLLLTAALSAVGKYIAPYLPEGALQIAGSAASFPVISVLFAMMFKWLPDTRVEWRDVWLGAILTAALFELGKFVIGVYIGKQGLESTYGAAASIVVVLIWVYYSAQLVLMGPSSPRSMRGATTREETGRAPIRMPGSQTSRRKARASRSGVVVVRHSIVLGHGPRLVLCPAKEAGRCLGRRGATRSNQIDRREGFCATTSGPA
jgi:membrane protein